MKFYWYPNIQREIESIELLLFGEESPQLMSNAFEIKTGARLTEDQKKYLDNINKMFSNSFGTIHHIVAEVHNPIPEDDYKIAMLVGQLDLVRDWLHQIESLDLFKKNDDWQQWLADIQDSIRALLAALDPKEVLYER